MATIDNILGAAVAPVEGLKATAKYQQVIDFAITNADADDRVNMLSIPANSLVKIIFDVQTAEGGVLTFDVGDDSAPDNFVDGANGNSAGTLIGNGGVGAAESAAAIEKVYDAADTIRLTPKNAADAAKILVTAMVTDLSDIVS